MADQNGSSKDNLIEETKTPFEPPPIGNCITRATRDLPKRRLAEKTLMPAKNSWSISSLAAVIAHEINNPLAGVIQNGQVILNRLSEESKGNQLVAEECGITVESLSAYAEKRAVFRMLEAMIDAGKKAAHIVEKMRGLSRRSDSQMALCQLTELLNATVNSTQKEYERRNGSSTTKLNIIREYEANLPPVPCVAEELEQVFLHVISNSVEAMTEANTISPTIIIRAKCDDTVARVEIEDTGPGMSELVRQRVFEPFFTTKGVQAGTGLGLSVSYFIVTELHGGKMEVDSQIGKGARFTIHLPLEQGGEQWLIPNTF